jgi:tRNA threonylcarbamoyladenosine biosynthesis protein TsaB
MLSLLIETSTERGCVALMEQANVLLKDDLPFGYNNSKHLIPAIHHLLKSAQVTPQQLNMITTGIGPGSYTGIRVGAMTAKALAYALKIPLVGVCSLEGFLPSNEGPFAAVIDAKVGGVYFLIGEKKREKVIYLTQPAICNLEDFAKKAKKIKQLVTPNASLLRPKLEKISPSKEWEWEEAAPNVISMTKKALDKWACGEISQEGKLELLYLRKTQAEIEKDQAQS